jgi:pimeloyl-ACP methyl ester carboxylesterase
MLTPPLQHSLRENSPPVRNPAELVFGRPQRDSAWQQRLAQVGMGSSSLSYGPGLQADVFYALDAAGRRRSGRLPVVVWLHAYSHAQGWSSKLPWNPNRASHYLDQRPSFDSLVRRGFVVVAFDQIGFGSRVHEGREFYDRYPAWSLLGKMVADTRAVVDALQALEEIDPARIFLLGYSLGAKVGLLTAALDDRVGGVAAVCGVDPIRLRPPDGETEGIRHYSHLHGLLPPLGFFIGHEERAPFDYDEVLALSAPRPLLIVAPELDRFAPIEFVRQEVAPARTIYARLGRDAAFDFRTPRDFNRFPRGLQEEVFAELERMSANR